MNIEKLHKEFVLFPLKTGSKEPKYTGWRNYNENNKYDFVKLAANPHFGIACGHYGLQVIDLDNHIGTAKEMLDFIFDNFENPNLPVIQTQNSGYHIYYKTKIKKKCAKLAKALNTQQEVKDIIDLKSEGGYVVYYDNIVRGDIFEIPELSENEVEILHEICRSFNTYIPKSKLKVKGKKAKGRYEQETNPFYVYNNDKNTLNEVKNMLIEAGWKPFKNTDKYWIRPGKEKGCSATLNTIKDGLFYCFTNSSSHFEGCTGYAYSGVLACLKFNGDYSKTAKYLKKKYNLKSGKKKTMKLSKSTGTELDEKWAALYDIIEKWKIKFRYNELTTMVDYSRDNGEYEQLQLLLGDIKFEFENNYQIQIAVKNIKEMIECSKVCEMYNPLDVFFNNIPEHDGTDYIRKLCECFEVSYFENFEFFYTMLKKHLIRTIRCAKESDYENRVVLTFHGIEDIGKTKFWQWLMSYMPELYSIELPNPNDKDSLLSIARYLLINIDDLDKLSEKQLSNLKSFITRPKVTKRGAWRYFEQHFIRICSFISSTNEMDFLNGDPNTRWLILGIKNINWQKYVKEITPEQIWAQVLAEYTQNKESGELTKDEKKERTRRNVTEFLSVSVENELVVKHVHESSDNKMTATDVKNEIENFYPNVRLNLSILSRELKRIFGAPTQCRFDGRSQKFYDIETNLKNSFLFRNKVDDNEIHATIEDVPF